MAARNGVNEMSHLTNTHSFNIDVANDVGVECAVIYQHLCGWIKHNIQNKKNFHDGLHWTYNSTKAFESEFTYFNSKKIGRLLSKLEERGYVKKGNYNKAAFDRTLWYACPLFEEEYLQSTKKVLSEPQQKEPGTKRTYMCNNSVPQNQTPEKFPQEVYQLVDYLTEITGRPQKAQNCELRAISEKLREGYTIDDFKRIASKKWREWNNNPDMKKFLTVKTLFVNHFEDYLEEATNERIKPTPKEVYEAYHVEVL